jgi:hypothetical protein
VDEVARACGIHGGEEKCIESFSVETGMKNTAWKICLWVRIILKWTLKKWYGREKQWAFMHVGIKREVP